MNVKSPGRSLWKCQFILIAIGQAEESSNIHQALGRAAQFIAVLTSTSDSLIVRDVT